MPLRAVAVDWSGRKSGERQTIRLAEAHTGELIRVEGGRNRAEVVDHLIAEAEADPQLVAAFDFSFSLPGWFLKQHQLTSAPQLWDLAATEGERWLSDCEPPFWGLAGRKRPEADPSRPGLRRTDIATASAAGGLMPRSPFQISGAGSVGASTLRGLPFLSKLRSAGFSVWPWDPLKAPAVIEIWTRVAIGSTVKSNQEARTRAVLADPRIPKRLKHAAAETEDSFDASVTAVWLSDHAADAIGTAASTDATELLEGRTWTPPAARLTE